MSFEFKCDYCKKNMTNLGYNLTYVPKNKILLESFNFCSKKCLTKFLPKLKEKVG